MPHSPLDELSWLMRWYAANCDEEWEHHHGIRIETLDNPGWRVTIDLRGTPLEGKTFAPVSFNEGASQSGGNSRWFVCTTREYAYYGNGGTFDLPILIEVFRLWAEDREIVPARLAEAMPRAR